jgi:beta-N-acetylhexosaminidase
MTARAFITGVSGTKLTVRERDFLREAEPWGFILFGRNIATPTQLRALTAACRDAVGRDAPVLIDQEGGRVQRLGPPHWPLYPPGGLYAHLYDKDCAAGLAAAGLGARLIAHDLTAVGIDVNCLPIADVPARGANLIIGDRAYGKAPDQVAAIGGAVAAGLLAGGVLPVLKHLPGHGRANADSHERLPKVSVSRDTLEACDFAAFRPLARLPLGMTAHVVFSAIDPIAPATTSVTIVQQVIRGLIGFEGLLMSDDIAMGALSGTPSERAQAAFAAGCDVVLHCNGKFEEMEEIAAQSPRLQGIAARRADTALAARGEPEEFDPVEARKTFASLIGRGMPRVARIGGRKLIRKIARKAVRRVARRVRR